MPLRRNVTTGGKLLLAPTGLLGVLAVLLGVAFWGMRVQDSSLDKALRDMLGKAAAVAECRLCICVKNDGAGSGATFTLELPIQPIEDRHAYS